MFVDQRDNEFVFILIIGFWSLPSRTQGKRVKLWQLTLG